jgi:hypothetical protein
MLNATKRAKSQHEILNISGYTKITKSDKIIVWKRVLFTI